MGFVTRFAPSPTGLLHKGHAYSALSAYRAAREAAGRFLLRIEDIDATRCRPEFEAAIFEDLAWLGLEWDQPVRRQSDHLTEYQGVIDDLRARGLVYRCFRTRKEVLDEIGRAPHGSGEGPDGAVFTGRPLPAAEEQAMLDQGKAFAWRLSLAEARRQLGAAWDELDFEELGDWIGPQDRSCPRTPPGLQPGVPVPADVRGQERLRRSSPRLIKVRPETAGDVVLGRKDVGVAYHLAVVWDDALQGVTDVIRGRDLYEATHIQRLLQALLGLPPPRYRHHELLTGPDGRRFAKRDRSQTLRELREGGMTAEALRNELGFA